MKRPLNSHPLPVGHGILTYPYTHSFNLIPTYLNKDNTEIIL